MITGMYQTSIGAHHHRSGRGKHRIQLPAGVRPVPEYFKAAGYWTCIGSGLQGFDHRGSPTKSDRTGKTDYNFDWDEKMYDSHDWAGRREGQPFFMQVQLHGGKIRGASEENYDALDKRMLAEFGNITNPNAVKLPPYYPRDPVILRDWSTYLDTVRITDRHVGRVMDRLRREGLLENTLVVFFTDHGISHARGKQFLYDEGTHIPLIVHGPGVAKGALRQDLVEHIDVAALSLAAAGLGIPATMLGGDILSSDYRPKSAVFGARDRCGETADHIRSVRTDRYLYIRNFYPQRPLLMPSQYKDSKLILQRLRELHGRGRLNKLSDQILFAPTRPAEELYLYADDRWQIRNLADDPELMPTLEEHRSRLDGWIRETGDQGPETPVVYAREIEDELEFIDRRKAKVKPARYVEFKRNAELYRRWLAEGK